MAIASNQLITYSDLYNYVYNNSITLFHNRDNYSSSVPNQFKPGQVAYSGVSQGFGTSLGTKYVRPVATVNANAALNVVATSTIFSHYNSFLTSRNLLSLSNKLITTEGILNFFNNIQCFFSVRAVMVTSSYTTTRLLFYDASSKSYPAVPGNYIGQLINDSMINSLMANLFNMIANNSRLVAAAVTYSASFS